MPLTPWLTLSREKILDCVIFSVLQLRRRNDEGVERNFYAIDTPDWVNVVAVTPMGEVVLIRQFRQGTAEFSLEVPGGVADEGESPIETGLRELEEETGYRATEALVLRRVRANPAIMDNWLTIVLALGAEPTGTVDFDESEDIEIELCPVVDIDRVLASGEVTHSYTVLSLREYQAAVSMGRSARH